ncbi:hypothetical protein M885DRAFT_532025 [Pelagophyceae sp. CCMP2097]|nr:hypothetical protein M885DRAFT_532025 [Pelagophyceae sp. CCMP2097]
MHHLRRASAPLRMLRRGYKQKPSGSLYSMRKLEGSNGEPPLAHHANVPDADSRDEAALDALKPAPAPMSAIQVAQLNKQVQLNNTIQACNSATAVLALFEQRQGEFQPANVDEVLHRLGTLSASFSNDSRPVLHRLMYRATASIWDDADHWRGPQLANAAWCVAKVGRDGSRASMTEMDLFKHICTKTIKSINTFEASDMAKISWAFSKANIHTPALFEAVANECVPATTKGVAISGKLANFSSLELANLLWAFANAGIRNLKLYDGCAKVALKKISKFNSQELAKTVWAFQKAKVRAPDLFKAMHTISR